jgi:hypothetical protein
VDLHGCLLSLVVLQQGTIVGIKMPFLRLFIRTERQSHPAW